MVPFVKKLDTGGGGRKPVGGFIAKGFQNFLGKNRRFTPVGAGRLGKKARWPRGAAGDPET